MNYKSSNAMNNTKHMVIGLDEFPRFFFLLFFFLFDDFDCVVISTVDCSVVVVSSSKKGIYPLAGELKIAI